MSLRRTFPVATSATNRSIENRSFSEKKTTWLPSGLSAGATFSSPALVSERTTRP